MAKMRKSTKQNKEKFLKRIHKSRGIISDACNAIGISRSTFYQWIEQDQGFKEEFEEAKDNCIDFVESKLLELIEGVQVEKPYATGEVKIYSTPPNIKAIEFYLSTIGRKRGYTKTQTIETDISITNQKFTGFNFLPGEDDQK